MSVDISPPDDGIPAAFGYYRWELAERPEGPIAPPVNSNTSSITFAPTRRGIYVLDRYFVGQSAEQLSYHVIVDVAGASPIPRISAPSMGAIGVAATFDGSESTSAELRPLDCQWRLAIRPENSSATLETVDAAMTTLIPDVNGDYKLELRVFDGELWSSPTAATLGVR